MFNPLEKIRDVRANLAVAERELDLIDEIMESQVKDATPESYRELAARLRAVAAAKEGDWITRTFTYSTAGELRCLADWYATMAEDESFWEGKG